MSRRISMTGFEATIAVLCLLMILVLRVTEEAE
jgi:hypothetical protein